MSNRKQSLSKHSFAITCIKTHNVLECYIFEHFLGKTCFQYIFPRVVWVYYNIFCHRRILKSFSGHNFDTMFRFAYEKLPLKTTAYCFRQKGIKRLKKSHDLQNASEYKIKKYFSTLGQRIFAHVNAFVSELTFYSAHPVFIHSRFVVEGPASSPQTKHMKQY